MAKSDGNRPGGDEGRSSITHTLEIFTKFAENYWLAGFGQVWAPGVGAMPIAMHIAASLDQRNAKQQPSTNNYRFRVGCDKISEPATACSFQWQALTPIMECTDHDRGYQHSITQPIR